jgi:proteic killer suppression protein
MIASFGDRQTADLYHGRKSARARRYPPDMILDALRKLDMLEAATRLEDLRSPPANRLEALRGDRKGLHSIRINDQWRIVFRWNAGDAHEVRIIDYH